MFADASALCAVLLEEPEAEVFRTKLVEAPRVWVSAVVVWETVRGVMKQKRAPTGDVRHEVSGYLATLRATLLEIGEPEQEAALDAVERFGKGRHSAELNMGDCFAYGCAKANGLPLLFKGNDFSQTDIEAA